MVWLMWGSRAIPLLTAAALIAWSPVGCGASVSRDAPAGTSATQPLAATTLGQGVRRERSEPSRGTRAWWPGRGRARPEGEVTNRAGPGQPGPRPTNSSPEAARAIRMGRDACAHMTAAEVMNRYLQRALPIMEAQPKDYKTLLRAVHEPTSRMAMAVSESAIAAAIYVVALPEDDRQDAGNGCLFALGGSPLPAPSSGQP